LLPVLVVAVLTGRGAPARAGLIHPGAFPQESAVGALASLGTPTSGGGIDLGALPPESTGGGPEFEFAFVETPWQASLESPLDVLPETQTFLERAAPLYALPAMQP
jgi:hypothetical protein